METLYFQYCSPMYYNNPEGLNVKYRGMSAIVHLCHSTFYGQGDFHKARRAKFRSMTFNTPLSCYTNTVLYPVTL